MADSTAGAWQGAESVRLPKKWTALVSGTRSDMGTVCGPGRAGADAVGSHCRGLGFGQVPVASTALPGAAHLAVDTDGFDAPDLLGYVQLCAPATSGRSDCDHAVRHPRRRLGGVAQAHPWCGDGPRRHHGQGEQARRGAPVPCTGEAPWPGGRWSRRLHCPRPGPAPDLVQVSLTVPGGAGPHPPCPETGCTRAGIAPVRVPPQAEPPRAMTLRRQSSGPALPYTRTPCTCRGSASRPKMTRTDTTIVHRDQNG